MKKLLCVIFGHRLIVDVEFSPTRRKVFCTRCRRSYGMHDGLQAFVEWDADLESVERFHR